MEKDKATPDNRAYLASVKAFAQILRFTRNFRYAQPLADITPIEKERQLIYYISKCT